MKFKVTLNNQGEKLVFYTEVRHEQQALKNAISQLAKRLSVVRGSLSSQFNGQKDNFNVKKVKPKGN